MPTSDAANTSTGERRETGESLGADEAGIATGKGGHRTAPGRTTSAEAYRSD